MTMNQLQYKKIRLETQAGGDGSLSIPLWDRHITNYDGPCRLPIIHLQTHRKIINCPVQRYMDVCYHYQ
jgi:hypothetical protein